MPHFENLSKKICLLENLEFAVYINVYQIFYERGALIECLASSSLHSC